MHLVYNIHQDLIGSLDLKFQRDKQKCRCGFPLLRSWNSSKFLNENEFSEETKIDLVMTSD